VEVEYEDENEFLEREEERLSNYAETGEAIIILALP
jgi:hypothetical protein